MLSGELPAEADAFLAAPNPDIVPCPWLPRWRDTRTQARKDADNAARRRQHCHPTFEPYDADPHTHAEQTR